jgi:hypothetical protein
VTKVKVKTTRKQQRKKKEDNNVPLEERTESSKLRVGAHVSIAGGRSLACSLPQRSQDHG